MIPQQRAQVVPCESCGTNLRNLLADCPNRNCLAAAIDEIVRLDRQIDAAGDSGE
jgi:hypothetical protein